MDQCQEGSEPFPEHEVIDYISKIERFSNYKVRNGLKPCDLAHEDWIKVSDAAHEAKAVHKWNRNSTGDTAFYPRSMSRNRRAFSITTTQHRSIIVAIQATRNDDLGWTVNLNAQPVGIPELGFGFEGHQGLLHAARELKEELKLPLAKATASEGSTSDAPTLIFTGHSSGAAIAQLLFAVFSDGLVPPDIPRVDCITFGGPPITSTSMSAPSDGRHLFLNIMNEGDPVALAQPAYIEKLLVAYACSDLEWKPPEDLVYQPSGRLLILRDTADRGTEAEVTEAFWADWNDIRGLIFGNPLRHSMTLYLNRAVELRDQESTRLTARRTSGSSGAKLLR